MKRYLLPTLFILFFAAALFAQEGDKPPLPEGKPFKRIEAIKIWKLTEVLDLNEEQSEKFFPRMRKLEKARRKTFAERRKLLGDLSQLLGEKESDKSIQIGIEKIINFDKKQRKEEEKLREDVMSVLSIRQQAKLLLFEERFGEEVKKIIKGLRNGKQKGTDYEKIF